jgi:hypothetical protein
LIFSHLNSKALLSLLIDLANWLTSIKALGLGGWKYMMKAMESWQRESHPTSFFTISDHLLKQST